ncbi:MAG: guanylate kinase [Eubacterium sp.]
MKRGVLTVISGFSGSGKGTLMKLLLEKYDNYALSISATTRKPRPGEVNGREYFFVTTDAFSEMIKNDQLIEYASYADNYYGTPKQYVNEQLDAGKDVILEIETQGALIIKKKFPESILLFVTPPSANELERRLVSRGTETDEIVAKRLSIASKEAELMSDYDYLVINDDLEICLEQMHLTIQNRLEKYKTSNNMEFINKMKNELKCFLKGE